jgi:exonuclease SbcC
MWKLEHISATDVCSFRELDYSPTQGVTTLVFGHNLDNENQQSNGSGKSTLLEAIALGITGSPLRKVSGAEIINDAADECHVELTFFNPDTDERMAVKRGFFRKGTSGVSIVLNGEEVSQPSVDAANRYILETLGITRDELFSSFILSKHRYEDFLSSSDKEKKEIINRFSNGVMVDQAIERVREDIVPVQERLREVDLELAGIEGRIEMLTEQIRTEEESREAKERTKEERIAVIGETIAGKRALVRDCEAGLELQKVVDGNIEFADKQIQALEESDEPLEGCLTNLAQILAPVAESKLTDWSAVFETKKTEIKIKTTEIDKWTTIIADIRHKISVAEADLIRLRSEHKVFVAESGIKDNELNAEVKSLDERLSAANARIEELKRRKRTLSGAIEILGAKLAGTVTCPACKHEFLVSDSEFDVEDAKAKLEENNAALKGIDGDLLDNDIEAEKVGQMKTHVQSETRSLEATREQWKERLAKGERAVKAAEYEMEGAQFNIKRIRDFVASRTKEVDDIRRKVFDEAFELIDAATRSGKRATSELKEKIAAAESSIETLEQTIAELKRSSGSELISSLRESLKTSRKKSGEVAGRKTEIEKEFAALTSQEQIFVQFRGYLANTKINALSAMMNQVLTDLGSDLRVNLSGYTQLKSGDIREKISVSITREGIDIGSFGKCSAGEAARINLASLLAMQRLVNGNAGFGKGLDLLVLDEILEAVDESGLASIFEALNGLGATALVVSHGLVNEGYPHRVTILKENGESRIKGVTTL